MYVLRNPDETLLSFIRGYNGHFPLLSSKNLKAMNKNYFNPGSKLGSVLFRATERFVPATGIIITFD